MAGVFGFAGDGVRFTAAFGRRSVSSGEKCKVHENRQSAAFFFAVDKTGTIDDCCYRPLEAREWKRHKALGGAIERTARV